MIESNLLVIALICAIIAVIGFATRPRSWSGILIGGGLFGLLFIGLYALLV